MTKEKRLEKRAERKLRKKVRKEAFNKFEEALNAFKDVDIESSMTFKEKFIKAWPVIKPSLEFAIALNITREKFDSATLKLVVIGDNMAGNQLSGAEELEFKANMERKWDLIQTALEVSKLLVNDKKDEIIDKIIEIGDWMFE